MRFAEKFGADAVALWEMLQGGYDADLGGGLFKYRLARTGQGASGGARAIVAMRLGVRVVLLYGFEKKDTANITARDLKAFKQLARLYLNFTESELAFAVAEKRLIDVRKVPGNPEPTGGFLHGNKR